MRTIGRHRLLLILFSVSLLSVTITLALSGQLGFLAGASGIPQTEPLYYAGVLASGSGTPLSGTYTIGAAIFDAASGGTAVCTTAAKSTTVTQGHFRIALDGKTCVQAVKDYPDLWIDITVAGASIGRTKIGAVPYAIETEQLCPPGYMHDTSTSNFVLCKRGNDEMVKVGDFWVDRYESAVVDETSYSQGKCNGTWTQYGAPSGGNFPNWFPENGNWTKKLYACSVSTAYPSVLMSWFQANQACSLSGKHLCTNGEWQIAASGTNEVLCNIYSKTIATTGYFPSCMSSWGVLDIVGNVEEWVDHWGQTGLTAMTSFVQKYNSWSSSGFNLDATWNINGTVVGCDGKATSGLPAAMVRGGAFADGTDAGVFHISFQYAPCVGGSNLGARCCHR